MTASSRFMAALASFGFFGSLLLGCAHFPSGEMVSASFPDDFCLTQIIHVVQGENRMDFIASLRRSGDDFRLAMLDPIVQMPLYVAHLQGGKLVETKSLPPEAKNMGAMLVESLVELFQTKSFVRSVIVNTGDDGDCSDGMDERTESGEIRRCHGREVFTVRTRRFDFEATPWTMEVPCPFPVTIWMRTRGGPDFKVTAVTEDLACGDP